MNLTPGSFQYEFSTNGEEQVEKPSGKPGTDNPPISSIVVRALKGNVGTVYIGGKGVSAANGFPLEPGDSISMDIQGLGLLFGIAVNAKDKLAFFYVGP